MEKLRADVVVYDRLVSDEILSLISSHSEKIDVGKQSSRHLVPQNEINRILLEKALEGKFVVRLKGGDPFLFGRGGEELDLLSENNVEFEVVPGITSAISAPSYAGIPVTHRDFCSSVHIITGHQKENEPLKIPFRALCELGGTLVFLMSVSSLECIMQGLLTAGMKNSTPAAIVENGTRADQRKLIGTIKNLNELASRQNFKSPSVIVVGEVCNLSDKYDWFSKQRLFGKKIITTRPKDSNGELSKKLRDLGAAVVEFPCIEIKELKDNYRANKVVEKIGEYSWLVFTSKNGVDFFFESLKKSKRDARVLGHLQIAVLGRQTAKALEEHGLFADFIPTVFDGVHLAEGLIQIMKPDEKALLFRALKGNQEIVDIFASHSIFLDDIPTYDTGFCNQESTFSLNTLNPSAFSWNTLKSSAIDYVTFTSASTVEGFVHSFPERDFSSFLGICIGQQTAKAANQYGIRYVVSDDATIESMINKIVEVSHDNNQTAKA